MATSFKKLKKHCMNNTKKIEKDNFRDFQKLASFDHINLQNLSKPLIYQYIVNMYVVYVYMYMYIVYVYVYCIFICIFYMYMHVHVYV